MIVIIDCHHLTKTLCHLCLCDFPLGLCVYQIASQCIALPWSGDDKHISTVSACHSFSLSELGWNPTTVTSSPLDPSIANGDVGYCNVGSVDVVLAQRKSTWQEKFWILMLVMVMGYYLAKIVMVREGCRKKTRKNCRLLPIRGHLGTSGNI